MFVRTNTIGGQDTKKQMKRSIKYSSCVLFASRCHAFLVDLSFILHLMGGYICKLYVYIRKY